MSDFTYTQGRYLAFVHSYTELHGYPPAESEIAATMCVSPPSVNQMVKKLEKKGLLLRQPGQPRSLRILVPEDEIPRWGNRQPGKDRSRSGNVPSSIAAAPAFPPANLYVLSVFLTGGPISKKFANKENSRVIEIRGDQAIEDLHRAFGYWFDFGDDWFHQIQVERIEQAIPTVTYPRVIKRVGKSPPQCCDQ